jgi:hypothetical protein
MSQKLDSLSKILIATGQINYMAASIDSVNEQIKMIPDKQELLAEVVTKLGAIMEDMGNLINGQDCICHIDERVSKVPFEIIIHGMDDTEKDYETEQEAV